MNKLTHSLLLAAALALASCTSTGSPESLRLTGYAQVTGDAVVVTDGQRAAALGSGYGEVGVRIEQAKLVIIPFLVEPGQVYLFANGKDQELAIPGPIPAWAGSLLGAELVAKYGLVIE